MECGRVLFAQWACESAPAPLLLYGIFRGSSACGVMMHNERGIEIVTNASATIRKRIGTGGKARLYRFFESSCARNPPMDSSSIVDVRSGVTSIIQEFSEASELFKKWRKGRAGKKAVGQEECETSLHEGKLTIEGTLNRFSQRHGARFNRGDSKNLTTPTGDTLTLTREMSR